jgi:hypothetical protein
MPERWPLALVTTMWGALLLRIAQSWNELPPLMATHFGPSGKPDGFMERGSFLLFTLIVEGGVTLLLLAAPLGLRLVPASLINMPHRDYWLAAPRREASLQRLGAWMAWLAVGMTAVLVGVNELLLRANLARAPLNTRVFLPMVLAGLTFVLGWTVALYRAFRVPTGRG